MMVFMMFSNRNLINTIMALRFDFQRFMYKNDIMIFIFAKKTFLNS